MKGMSGAFLALILASTPAWAGNGFKAMAKDLSRAAKKAGMERVALLPFVPADGGSANDGWSISEKMTTQVVNIGQVQVVERSLLKKLLDEHHLGQTGIIDQTLLKKLGKVFSVEGVMTGSFVTSGREFIVQARLINIETGVIVAATERKMVREWFDSSAPASGWSSLRDSLAENSCLHASEKVDHLNKEILDIKARYWALELKKGIAVGRLRHNPGSEISDPALKNEFYGRMKTWYAQDKIPALTPYEVKRFVELDAKAFGLYQECGNTEWFVAGK